MSFIKFASFDAESASYTFDLTADVYYTVNSLELNDTDPAEIFTITVYLAPDSEIICENCDTISAPYFWLHQYYGLHSCFSHLPESTQTEILAQIKNINK